MGGVLDSIVKVASIPFGGGIAMAADAVDLNGSRAANRAFDAQENAANQANATAKQIYDQQRADNEPFRQAGIAALSGIQENKFMDNWQQQDGGYQARLNEGLKAVQGSAAARGLGNSGAAMKQLSRYGQDYASNEYSKAYDRNYGRLSQLAGLGSSTTAQNNQNAGAYGQQVSGNQMGVGNAYANKEIAQSGRNSALIGQGVQGAATFFSDERLKTNISPVTSEEKSEMKSLLKAFHYNYTQDSHGRGDWIGVMAQDLEKSKLGRTLVDEDESGHKTISLRKVMSMFLATMAEG